MTLLTPLLSVADPELPSEGNLDPLGLYAIADRLASRLVPGVRQRMSCPRFLTVLAVGRELTQGYEPDETAADGVSSPEMVFEWIVVEALVRTEALGRHWHGLPGSRKARSTLDRKGRLSARTYLKSARTMGFGGHYRTLARELGVLDDELGGLGELGQRLVAVWEEEQGLTGFREPGAHPKEAGARLRRRLHAAVRAGMEAGAVTTRPGSSLWESIELHLAPESLGPGEELELLRDALLDPSQPFRADVLRFLVSDAGKEAAWEDDVLSERAFHKALEQQASPELAALLEAIDVFESFARLLQNAFEECLEELTRTAQPTAYTALARLESIEKGAKEAQVRYDRACERLGALGEHAFQATFEPVAEPASAAVWVERLLDLHEQNQRRKTKQGKMPWFWKHADGVEVRPAYRRHWDDVRSDNAYVHAYRTLPLWSFARDLGLVSS